MNLSGRFHHHSGIRATEPVGRPQENRLLRSSGILTRLVGPLLAISTELSQMISVTARSGSLSMKGEFVCREWLTEMVARRSLTPLATKDTFLAKPVKTPV